MPMMQVRVVNMSVAHSLMPMPMRMRFRHWTIVLMLMVLVVNVTVLMLNWLVLMLVVMPLGQMQPQTDPHQDAGHQQLDRYTKTLYS
jgi:uncharacterized membrane protein YdbT with pleckstrin-like domain